MIKKMLLTQVCVLFIFMVAGAQEGAVTVSNLQAIGFTELRLVKSSEFERTVYGNAEPRYINETPVNLNETVFTVSRKDNYLDIVQQDPAGNIYKLEFDGTALVFSNNENSKVITDETISEIPTDQFIKLFVLQAVLKEVELNFDEEIISPPAKASIKIRICDHVIISGGLSKSVAETRCVAYSNAFLKTHKDCTRLGSCDISCAWGDHLCVATALFTCTGNTCWF